MKNVLGSLAIRRMEAIQRIAMIALLTVVGSSFILLATCSDPFASDEGQGIFTINLSTRNLSANDSGRSAIYPPDLPDKPNPGAPKLEELRFVVYFTRLTDGVLESGAPKKITVERTSVFKGKIETGDYVVKMDVYVIKEPDIRYAWGVANGNPITINGGYNDITIEAYSANNAEPPVIMVQPVGGAYSLGAEAVPISVSVDAVKDGGTLKYQWYMNTTDSNSGGTPVGANQASYVPSTAAESADYYYCVVSNDHGTSSSDKASTSIFTKTATIVVIDDNAQTPIIDTQPDANTTISKDETATLTVAARITNGGTLTYQWYSNTQASNSGGTSIDGATTASYTTPILNTDDYYYYYCVITNTNNEATGAKVITIASSVATVTVTASPPPPPVDAQTPIITTQPAANTNILTGGTAALTVSASVPDGGTLSYQWYSNTSASNSGGASIGGAGSASYTTPSLNTAGTYYYYCIITNTNNSVNGIKVVTITSNLATVTVNAPIDAQTPIIGTQPVANTNIPTGGTATLTVAATVIDGGTISYQWYSNAAASNSGGTSIGGAASASYTTPTLNTAGSYYYYCVITNTNNSATGAKVAWVGSSLATVTVTGSPPPPVNAQTPTISTQPAANTFVQTGGTVTLSVSASVTDSGTISYQWYSNTTTSISSGTSISGATSSTYDPSTATPGTSYYYVIVTNAISDNGDGGTKTATLTSSVAKVTITNIVHDEETLKRVGKGTGAWSLSASYLQIENIELSSNWTPIGFQSSDRFTGSYDGGGYTISGIIITQLSNGSVGLFSSIGNGGIVENVGLDIDIDVVGANVGGIAGYNSGTVQNCYVTGNVKSSSGSRIGGVVGQNDLGGTVQNCYVTCDVSGNDYVGGVVGSNVSSTVRNCVALNLNINGVSNVGRVVGSSGTLTNNYGSDAVVGNWTSSANGLDGEDITSTQWDDASWWKYTVKFSTQVWDIEDDRLPTLRN